MGASGRGGFDVQSEAGLLGAVLVLVGYLLGCLSAGYYVVRLRTGGDVRHGGSGGVGATNVGRVLGSKGFALVFILDLLKGALATALAVWTNLGAGWVALVMLAVTAGHVWPVQLGFRGGKGVATAWGAALVAAPWVALTALGVAIVVWVPWRRVTYSGLVGIASVPLLSLFFGRSTLETVGISALALLVLFAHRMHLAALWTRRQVSAGTSGAAANVSAAPGAKGGRS